LVPTATNCSVWSGMSHAPKPAWWVSYRDKVEAAARLAGRAS
jgi:hypothetical protein